MLKKEDFSRLEINLNGCRDNYTYFRSKLHDSTKLLVLVKANAYGHGAEETVCALSNIADCFAVALIEEAISIRSAVCGKDVLVFTPPTVEEDVFALQENGFIATVDSLSTARLVKRSRKARECLFTCVRISTKSEKKRNFA